MAEEKWIKETHCLLSLRHANDQDAEGQYLGGLFHKHCGVCGFRLLVGFRRYGSPRPFESVNKIRFFRECHKGFALGIRNLNGIQRGTWFKKILEWSIARQIFANCMFILLEAIANTSLTSLLIIGLVHTLVYHHVYIDQSAPQIVDTQGFRSTHLTPIPTIPVLQSSGDSGCLPDSSMMTRWISLLYFVGLRRALSYWNV